MLLKKDAHVFLCLGTHYLIFFSSVFENIVCQFSSEYYRFIRHKFSTNTYYKKQTSDLLMWEDGFNNRRCFLFRLIIILPFFEIFNKIQWWKLFIQNTSNEHYAGKYEIIVRYRQSIVCLFCYLTSNRLFFFTVLCGKEHTTEFIFTEIALLCVFTTIRCKIDKTDIADTKLYTRKVPKTVS